MSFPIFEIITAEECAGISFNPMFSIFEMVRDYCELVLNNCISFDYKNDLKLFAFLLRIEYVFEEFMMSSLHESSPFELICAHLCNLWCGKKQIPLYISPVTVLKEMPALRFRVIPEKAFLKNSELFFSSFVTFLLILRLIN